MDKKFEVRVEFVFGGINHIAEISKDYEFESRPWGYKRQNPRAYVGSHLVEFESEMLQNFARISGANSIYDSNEILDTAWKHFNAIEILAQTALLKAGLEALGVTAKEMFSRKAGCSCGCSPGFVLKYASIDRYMNVNIWEVKEEIVIDFDDGEVLEKMEG